MAYKDKNNLLRAVYPILVLYTLLNSPKHGYEIALMLKNSEHRIEIDAFTVYRILNKLKEEGYVTEDSKREIVNNRARTNYLITDDGHSFYKQQIDEIIMICTMIVSL